MRNKLKKEEFKRRPWRAHTFLAGVPLRTLEKIDLQGGREGMTIEEISAITGFGGEKELKVGPLTQSLFWLRGLIGRIFGWDDVPDLITSHSYLTRLSAEDRARSLVKPGKASGISRILYQCSDEMLGEIINRTVHCFWVMAVERTSTGYTLWMAIYVRRLNAFTPVYMALISPVLKWFIYPVFKRSIKKRWAEVFSSASPAPSRQTANAS
jgi:hypothetical protein